MENTARQYDVFVFPYPEPGDTPGCEIHVEVAGSFKEFRDDLVFWLEMFGGNRLEGGGDYRCWIDDGSDKIGSRCDEAEVILSLLYCCKNHEVTVREISYQGSKYTDISDIKFLEGFEENLFGDIGQTYPVRLHAKKNGRNVLLYFFGPYLSSLDVDEDDRDFYYPSIRIADSPSTGIVEAEENQRFYAGTFFYHSYFEELGVEPYDSCCVYEYDEGVEVFLETDGKSVTFSMLLGGELHKKIRVDEKKAVFYSLLCDGKLLEQSSFWQHTDKQDVVFERDSSGRYLYTGESEAVVQKRLSNVFLPPQTPELDSLDTDTAHRLCEEYIKAFYPADDRVTKLCAAMEMRTRIQERLKGKVKGQDMAVEKFVDGYIRYQIRGKVPGKPAGLYLFAGPPGTGKTYLAETFAKDVAGEGYRYKRFDMSAYGGEGGDSVTGLVGFERTWKGAQPGQLTDFVRVHPKCILLFDEIEKASKPVRLLFLSILEGAALTDKYYNEPVSFEDAILIFTTNEGKDLYEDNRETNLTALPDSAVLEGLQASNFAPELISRFMSGTIIVFNHLSYLDMSDIFKDSLRTAVEQIGRESLNFDLKYDDKLSKLYLLSKGDGIDARFISANTRRMVEDHFLSAMEFMRRSYFEELNKLGHAKVSVEVTDEVRPYFEITDQPRILGYIEKGAQVYTKRPNNRKREALQQLADCVWAEDRQSLQEHLENCNWNSRKKEDKYDAILIDLGGNARRYRDTEGYRCLKTAVEAKPDIPIIVVDRGTVKEKAPLIALGVTDFVRGRPKKAQPGDQENPAPDGGENQRQECLVLDGTALRTILDRQHFLKMARELARRGLRISSEVVRDYKKKTGMLEICFTDLHVEEAEKENAESRRQNKKYLLEEKPQVRLQDIFSAESVKKDIRRCIDNIKNPGKYTQSGARLITGILMYGAPGMGKTMFAKAMAFESGAAFISAVGSDFLNGDGVVKMEEMFRTARRKKPCILFIDEFDAISKDRGGQITGGQEIVLEKFLKEMDGLETDNDGVYVVGVTNYPLEQLDGAVRRRFSTKIPFPYPTLEDRQKFLLRVLEKKDLRDKISERAASTLIIQMYGKMSTYSEIETFIEESIARAVYEEKPVTEKFLFDRVHEQTDGAVRQRTDLNTYMATAYHEAGHAVLQYYFGGELAYVTIVPRGEYGGYTMAPFRAYTGQDFLARICISFAGRIAETIYMEHISKTGSRMGINAGASSDLQTATQFAYEYVCRYGLSERTMVVPGVFMPLAERYPEAVLPEAEKEAIWTSVKQVLEQQQQDTRKLLQQYWGEVEALAYSLIYMQELTGEKAESVIRTRTPYVEECCFWDSDVDYERAVSDGAETVVPCGYPIYPYYPKITTQLEEKHLTETDSRQYFYAVKKARGGLLLSNDLQEAFSEAYRNYAVCRRFTSEKAAREYLQMLEIKVFRQGEECFAGFYADARAEMEGSRAAVKDLIILKQGDMYRRMADEAGLSLASYLMGILVDDFLDKYENAYRVIQVYDEQIKQELTAYMDALDYQRYRRQAGYED